MSWRGFLHGLGVLPWLHFQALHMKTKKGVPKKMRFKFFFFRVRSTYAQTKDRKNLTQQKCQGRRTICFPDTNIAAGTLPEHEHERTEWHTALRGNHKLETVPEATRSSRSIPYKFIESSPSSASLLRLLLLLYQRGSDARGRSVRGLGIDVR